VAICTASSEQYSPQIVSDGSGGAIITWTDYRNGNSDIYAQVVNSSGSLDGGSPSDTTDPVVASVTTPSDGAYYKASSMPSAFSGWAADNSGGSGLAANSTTFTLQRGSDSAYWDGTDWVESETWLATTHDATSDGSTVTWTDAIDLPTWADGTYAAQAKAIDTEGNTYTGAAVTFV